MFCETEQDLTGEAEITINSKENVLLKKKIMIQKQKTQINSILPQSVEHKSVILEISFNEEIDCLLASEIGTYLQLENFGILEGNNLKIEGNQLTAKYFINTKEKGNQVNIGNFLSVSFNSAESKILIDRELLMFFSKVISINNFPRNVKFLINF